MGCHSGIVIKLKLTKRTYHDLPATAKETNSILDDPAKCKAGATQSSSRRFKKCQPSKGPKRDGAVAKSQGFDAMLFGQLGQQPSPVRRNHQIS
jgi:hypothetical protein